MARKRTVDVQGKRFQWGFGGMGIWIKDDQGKQITTVPVPAVIFAPKSQWYGITRDMEKRNFSLKPGHVKMFICKTILKCDHVHHVETVYRKWTGEVSDTPGVPSSVSLLCPKALDGSEEAKKHGLVSLEPTICVYDAEIRYKDVPPHRCHCCPRCRQLCSFNI